MALLGRTDWALTTSEDTSVSVFATVSYGALYVKRDYSDPEEVMKINYRAVGIGMGKGPPVGAQWSNTSDPSGGFDNVGVIDGQHFESTSFPCRGYLFGFGASAAVIGSIFGMDVTGGGVTAVIFGMGPPFAGIRLWGFGRGALPGAGISGAVALFELDDGS